MLIPKIIIGLGHRSGVGKDTIAKFLNIQLTTMDSSLRVKKESFAWELKLITYRLYAWAGVKPPIHYENNRADREIVLPAIGKTVVDLWIEVGNKLRDVHEGTWIDYLLQGQTELYDVLIIPDVRFPNEANKIVELGGRVYRVENPRIPRRSAEGKLSSDDFLNDWPHFRATLMNDQDMKHLMKEVVTPIALELIKELRSDV